MEEIIVVSRTLLFIRLIRLVKPATFVNRCQLLDHVIVKSIEHNQKDANTGGESQNPLGGETVRFELPILERPNKILFILVIAIQWCKIEVG